MSNIFRNWNKSIYISTLKETIEDDYGNDINYYNKPTKYNFNIQPASGSTDIAMYGEKVSKMYKAILTPYEKYINKFNEGDVAYFDGVIPLNETEGTYGRNANYKIVSVRPQNTAICMYLEKIEK